MNRIKGLRLEKGLSQAALGKLVHVEQQTVAGYEQENFSPSLDVLKRIATIFDASIEYIIGETDNRTPVDHLKVYELDESESLLIDRFRQLSMRTKADVVSLICDIVEEHN